MDGGNAPSLLAQVQTTEMITAPLIILHFTRWEITLGGKSHLYKTTCISFVMSCPGHDASDVDTRATDERIKFVEDHRP